LPEPSATRQKNLYACCSSALYLLSVMLCYVWQVSAKLHVVLMFYSVPPSPSDDANSLCLKYCEDDKYFMRYPDARQMRCEIGWQKTKMVWNREAAVLWYVHFLETFCHMEMLLFRYVDFL
jgi:hypothetical protein